MKIIHLLIISLLIPKVFSSNLDKKITPLKKVQLEKIEKGEVIAFSEVTTHLPKGEKNKKQSLNFFIAGLHKKSCRYAMRKLSMYEKLKNYLGFVTESLYDPKTKIISLTLDHALLPISMGMTFKIPRIKKEGTYPYSFHRGFLKGLRGNIHLFKHKNRCLFYTDANWYGPHSGYSDFIFELFSSTLARIAMNNLLRISTTY